MRQGVTTCSVIALWGTGAAREGGGCGTGAEKLEKRRSGRACSLDTKRVRSGNWSNIQSIAFSFALLSKRNGFALGLRIFTFWLVCLRRYLPHDLFSLSTT